MICAASRPNSVSPLARKPLLSASLCLALALSACSRPQRHVSSTEAVKEIEAQADKARSCRGRAWINVHSSSGSASFSGVVVIDRGKPGAPNMRIEALDPFGTLHHLFLVDGAKERLTWADFDRKRLREAQGRWHGVPVRLLPHLILGSLPPTALKDLGYKDVVVGATPPGQDAFVVQTDQGPIEYLLSWIDPGPRVVMSGLRTTVPQDGGTEAEVSVAYGHFGDKKDFYLPQSMGLTVALDFEMKASWREREWNKSADAALFSLTPAQTKGLVREAMH